MPSAPRWTVHCRRFLSTNNSADFAYYRDLNRTPERYTCRTRHEKHTHPRHHDHAGPVYTSNAQAATREEKRVSDAADVLDQLARIPEKSIPPSLLSRAYGVAVIPGVVRAAFGIGASRGKGIIVVRQDDDSWSNPAFITITAGSFGWQVGADSTDIILVFKTRKGVDGIANGKLTLGANASVAAGPVGRVTRAPRRTFGSRPKCIRTRAAVACLQVSRSRVPASRWIARRTLLTTDRRA